MTEAQAAQLLDHLQVIRFLLAAISALVGACVGILLVFR